MKNDLTALAERKETMTSLEIAEVIGKRHADVMRDVRNLLERGVAECNFALGSYKDKNNQERPCYELTKKGCLILASGYDALLREKIINRWEELETKERMGGFAIPQTFSQALLLAAKQQEQIEAQRLQLEEQGEEIEKLANEVMTMKPKATYYDVILNNPSTVAITQIAQDYGMSAKKFNKILADFRIQRKVNKQWILYANYLDKGYVQSKPFNISNENNGKVVYNTEWTQKGRLFIYEKLKHAGIVPLIENKELFT